MNADIRTIGVAGYMGAGKSVVATILAGQRGEVIVADRVAKEFMTSDPRVHNALREAFGSEIVGEGFVRFEQLGPRVFGSRAALDMLNAIVHPPLIRHLRTLLDTSPSRPCVLDAALIPLWGIERWFDLLIWVSATPKTRANRLAKRDNQAREEIERRVRMQESLFSEPENSTWCIVENEGTIEDLCGTIDSLLDGKRGSQEEVV